MAANLMVANKMIERIINRNRNSFPFHPKDLNLKPNMGMSIIIKAERIKMVPYKTFPVKAKELNPKELFNATNNKPTTKIVAPGVAKP